MRNTNDSASPRRWIAETVVDLPRSGIRDFFELVQQMDDVISLGVGEPDFVTPWGIREAAIYGLDRGHTSYTSNLGTLALREAIAAYVADHFGLAYEPSAEVIVTVGVSEALDLALRAILDPGDEIIYHEPCYVSYNPLVQLAHAKPLAVQTRQENDFALDPDDVAARITPRTKALLLNFPCNPTGADLDPDQKARLAEIAVEHDLLVITDEIYAELTYEERPPCIATFPGMRERTLFLHGFSKAFAMTGWRIGYACGPPDLIEAMMKIHQYSMLCAPIMAQEAAVEALQSGAPDVAEMRGEYRQRRNVITRRLNAMGLDCVCPRGAFYAYPSIASTGLPAGDFARRLLEEENVAVVPGTAFCRDGAGHVRCAYATNMELIVEAMDRLERFLGRL